MRRRLQNPARAEVMLLLGTFSLLVVVRALFLITFPLNNLAGDASVYFDMTLARRSNLVLAPGYPFLIGLLPSFLSQTGLVRDSSLANLVLLTQHMLDLAVSAAVLLVLRRVVGPLSASLAVLAYGTSVFALSVTSAAYPEWLQGDLLALTFVFGYVAFRSTGWRHLLGYLGVASCGAWCVLAKFNSAPSVTLVLLLVLVADPSPFAGKARALGVAVLVAGLSVGAFVWTYHRPSTGTMALNHDRSWVLVQRIEATFGNDALVRFPTGIAARRWLALATVLPPRYDLAHAYAHVREPGSGRARSKYRADVDRIMAMDGAGLRDLLSRRALPAEFSLARSSIPVSLFVGLAESDDLGIAVYRDFVAHNAPAFARSVMEESWRSLGSRGASPLVPLRDRLAAFHLEPAGALGWGFREYAATLSAPPPHLCVYAHRGTSDVADTRAFAFALWDPGVALFTWMDRLERLTRPPLWIPVVLVAVVSSLKIRADRMIRPDTLVALGACAVVMGFVVFSNTIFFFRWKEARFISWPNALLLALAVTWAIPWLVRSLRR